MTIRGRDVLVGLDAGGSYVKATVLDLSTGMSTTSSRAAHVDHPRPGHNERDAELLWRTASRVLRETLDSVPGAFERIAVVGVTAHGNGAYLVDAAGEPTRAAVQASDTRAASLVSNWISEGVADDLRAEVWNGLWPGQPGPILAWLSRHEPEVIERSSAVLMCGDYLRARLTGTLTGELTAWSCNGLLDSANAQLSDNALAAYGIGHLRRLMPQLASYEDALGTVSDEAAATTGLPSGVPVVSGAVDNVAMHVGAGVVDGSRIVVGAGTWSINQLLVPATAMTLDGPLGAVKPHGACLAVPDSLALLIEASATSAATLDWALQRVTHGVTATASKARTNVYAHAVAQVAARSRRPDAPMFVPFLDGSRDQPMARGAWLGLASTEDDIDLLGGVVEGVCMEHRRHVDRLSRATDVVLPLRLVGGASRNEQWAQLFADVTGRPVEVSPVSEIGTIGAAVIAGTAVGVFSSLSDGLSQLNPTHRSYEPHADAIEFYDHRYQRYTRWATTMEAEPWPAEDAAIL